jgi:hypothetical protein
MDTADTKTKVFQFNLSEVDRGADEPKVAHLTTTRSKSMHRRIGAKYGAPGVYQRNAYVFPCISMKKRLNVDSPTFTPASHNAPSLAVNGAATKSTGLSPKAASAAPFKPKGFSSSMMPPSQSVTFGINSVSPGVDPASLNKKQYNPAAPDWALGPSPDIQEFLPQPQTVVTAMVSLIYLFRLSSLAFIINLHYFRTTACHGIFQGFARARLSFRRRHRLAVF